MGLNSAVANMVTCRPGCISERGILELKLSFHSTQGLGWVCHGFSTTGSQQLLEKAPCLVVVDVSRGLGGTPGKLLPTLIPSKYPQGSMSKTEELQFFVVFF